MIARFNSYLDLTCMAASYNSNPLLKRKTLPWQRTAFSDSPAPALSRIDENRTRFCAQSK